MKVGDVDQVLPIVRYWIPHSRVISPEGWQGELEAELKSYLEGVGTTSVNTALRFKESKT